MFQVRVGEKKEIPLDPPWWTPDSEKGYLFYMPPKHKGPWLQQHTEMTTQLAATYYSTSPEFAYTTRARAKVSGCFEFGRGL